MEIRLLESGYMKNEQFYLDFLNDEIKNKEEYFSDKTVIIDSVPDFPIYMGKGSEKEKLKLFEEAFDIISKYYINTERDIHLNQTFWHTLLITEKREYLLNQFPEIKDSYSKFKNIVIKKFDWENYIYKCVIAAQYINDNVKTVEDRMKYLRLIVENLDIYNYIIKYEIFRNDKFLINVLDIINDNDLSKILKAKITHRDDLGKDPRVGRMVIFELNKSYPVLLSPTLDKKELERVFMKHLYEYMDPKDLEDEVQKYQLEIATS